MQGPLTEGKGLSKGVEVGSCRARSGSGASASTWEQGARDGRVKIRPREGAEFARRRGSAGLEESGDSEHRSRAPLLALRLAGAGASRGPLCSLTNASSTQQAARAGGCGGAGRQVREGYTDATGR